MYLLLLRLETIRLKGPVLFKTLKLGDKGNGYSHIFSLLIFFFSQELLMKDKVEKVTIVSFYCHVSEEIFFYSWNSA